MLARRLAVPRLVVEEHVGAEGTQEYALVEPAEKQTLINPDIPGAQCAHHPLVGRRGAGRHQRRSDRALLTRELALQLVQCGEKRHERSARQGLARRARLVLGKRLEALLLENALGVIGEQHGITVEGNAQFLAVAGPCTGQDGGGSETTLERTAYIILVRRQEQVRAESGHITVRAGPSGERCAGDRQAVVLDGV